MDNDEQLQAIRDLVYHHPLNSQLAHDLFSWRRLGRGLDDIANAASLEHQVAALNVVRLELGMDAVDAREDELPSALSAGLLAVLAELEHRVNVYRASHDAPLSDLFQPNIDFQLDKVHTAVRACFPGEQRGALDVDRRLGIDSLRETFEQLLEELRRRGYDKGSCYDTENALYILQRATALVGGERGVDARDVALLVSYGLRRLVKSAQRTAAEIDATTTRREAGWTPPPERTG